jgi:hypothetical protein
MVCNIEEDLQAARQIGETDHSAAEEDVVQRVNAKLGKTSCVDGDFYATIGETVGEVAHGDIHGAIRRLSITQVCRDGFCIWSASSEGYGAFPLQGKRDIDLSPAIRRAFLPVLAIAFSCCLET